MTTVSAPVYQDDVLRGSLSIDISIAQIDWMLRRYSVPCSSVHIMYTGGMELLGTGGAPPAVDPALLPVGVLTAEGRFFLTPFPLSIEGMVSRYPIGEERLFHGTNPAEPAPHAHAVLSSARASFWLRSFFRARPSAASIHYG
jgi:hypothetical protein